MATADEYAGWIVQNKDKAGTEEFNIVAQAYEQAKAAQGPSKRGLTGDLERGAAQSVVSRERTVPIQGDMNTPEFALRKFGSALRSGVGSILDTPQNLFQLGEAGAGFLAGETLSPDIARSLMPDVGSTAQPRYVSRLLEQMLPLPTPPARDNTQQMIGTGAEAVGYSIMPGAKLNSLGNVVRNVGIPAAGAVVGEQLGGETGKLLGMVAAPMLGNAVAGGVIGDAEKAAARISAFDRNKIPFTLADIGQNRAGPQKFLDPVPIASSVAAGAAEAQRRAGRTAVQEMLSKVGTQVDDRLAGMRVAEGLDNWKRKVSGMEAQFKAQVDSLYPPSSMIQPNETLNTLATLTTAKPGAQSTTARLIDSEISKMASALQDDVQRSNGTVSYEGLDALRKRVGDIAFSQDSALIGTSRQREYKDLYRAISQDIEDGALQIGPQAAAAVRRKNRLWEGVKNREEQYLSDIYKKAEMNPDTVVQDLVRGRSAERFRQTWASLGPSERDAITGNVLAKLGKPTAGKSTGDYDFSLETFMTNYNNLSDPAKKLLFSSGRYSGLQKDMDAFTEALGRIRQSGRAYANPSGTGGKVGNVTTFFVALNSLGNNPAQLVKVVGGLSGGAAVESLLTSSAFVRSMAWMARHPKESIGTGMQRLNAALGMQPDENVKRAGQAFTEYVQQLSGEKQ